MKRRSWAAVGVIAIAMLSPLMLGTYYYAARERTEVPKTRAFTVATGAGEITAAGGRAFAFPDFVDGARFVIVQVSPGATADLVCRIGKTTANASSSEWDFWLKPGEAWSGFGNAQLGIAELACQAVDDAGTAMAIGTEGTAYIVKGVD